MTSIENPIETCNQRRSFSVIVWDEYEVFLALVVPKYSPVNGITIDIMVEGRMSAGETVLLLFVNRDMTIVHQAMNKTTKRRALYTNFFL